MKILAFNVGSSSIRASVLNCIDEDHIQIEHQVRDAHQQLDAILDECAAFAPFSAIAHRIVHGGSFSLNSARIMDDAVRAEIEASSDLAPDHNPAALRVAARAKERFGTSAAAVAVFDSAFHRTMPPYAYTYPIPRAVSQRYGIRRYGFHGLSHEYSARVVKQADPRRPLRHVSVHIGNGVSAASILDGASIDTTMGYTPLEGAMMGSRSGSLDPGVIFELERKGFTSAQLRLVMDGESGLLGISGVSSDFRRVSEEAQTGNEACLFALELYRHRLAGEIARMAASARGLDVLSFTGGAGENSPVLRAEICAQLAFLDIELDPLQNHDARNGQGCEIGTAGSGCRVFVIAANEAQMIGRHAFATVSGLAASY